MEREGSKMKTLRELFEREEGYYIGVTGGIGTLYFRKTQFGDTIVDSREYYKALAEWLEKGVEKQYAIRDKLIRNLMKENDGLKDEVKQLRRVIEDNEYKQTQ
jgi:hypothetical protein